MAHVTVEWTDNLDGAFDLKALLALIAEEMRLRADGVFPIGELLLCQMLAKVVLSAVLVPPLVYGFVGLGRRLDATNAN